LDTLSPKLDFGICTYANPRGLDLALSSISQLGARTIVVYTRYQGFSHEDPDSLTLSKAVLEQYPNTVLIHQSEPLTQIEARNKYLETTEADFLIVMDDDEIVYRYNTEKFQKGLEMAKEMLGDKPHLFGLWYMQQNGIPTYLSRLLYLPQRFKYVDNHFHFTIDGKYYGAHSRKSIDGLTLRHQKPEDVGRSKEFEKGMERYEIWQHFNEKQY
jgi:hypothetical protein